MISLFYTQIQARVRMINIYHYKKKRKSMFQKLIISYVLAYIVNSYCGVTVNCDPRCSGSCDVENDVNFCCACQSSYSIAGTATNLYYWQFQYDDGATNPRGRRCGFTCPSDQYPNSSTKKCTKCNTLCETCTGPSNTECKTCKDSYALNSNACYLLTNNTVYNPCPDPYYGIQRTMRCERCPVGSTRCAIFLAREMPGNYFSTYTMSKDCPGDSLCTYALKSQACDGASYVLNEGFCISKNRCRTFSWYNSTASGFNAGFCYCKDYFYLSATTTCELCHYKCKTCSGPNQSQCLTCPYEAADCSFYNSTFEILQDWGTSVLVNTSGNWVATYIGANSPVTADSTNCSASKYVFDYYGYDTVTSASRFQRAQITYFSSGVSSAHYGITFKGTFLFIDNWANGIQVIFSENNQEKYAYSYDQQNVIGKYLCGRNYYDHFAVIQFWFPHTRNNNVSLKIQTSHSGYAWGLKEVMVHVLVCDSSCHSCKGPTQYDCVSCAYATQVLVNNDCVCDIDNNYYNDTSITSGADPCKTSCPNGEYKNKATRSCTVGCPNFPYEFKEQGPPKICVQNCINSFYKHYANMSCIAGCYDSAITDDTANYYKFDGLDKTCYNICPDGYYGDPVTGYCVTVCPITSGNHGYFSQGKFCVQVCSASKYAYHPTRECLTQCPTGFYKSNKGLQNICEEQCSITLDGDHELGDNSTGKCVDNCPPDSYADFTKHLCLAVCNQSAYKQQINNSGIIIRTCVETCTTGQYANNHTDKCGLAILCPQGTYGDPDTTFCEHKCTDTLLFGDNFTHKCQSTCNNNSFKQNDTKLCVQTCPITNNNNKQEWGDLLYTGYCLQKCFSDTFADFQSNRQCVRTCSDGTNGKVQSYGQNFMCVYNCSNTTWADPFHANRICTTSCTYNAIKKSFGFNDTRKCVQVCPDPQFGIVINLLPVCVDICENTFGNPETNLCVQKCPFPYYGDPTGNRTCVKDCPDDYFAQNTTSIGANSDIRECVTDCQYGWADNFTRTCATAPQGCFSGLFAHQTNHKCVIASQCTGFGDPVTRKCVPTCIYNVNVTYFGDPYTKRCVLVCPVDPNYFGDQNTHQCQSACSQSTVKVRDPQFLRRCVNTCSRSPIPLFADFLQGLCVSQQNCTRGQFSDNFTKKCQTDCQGSILQYADPVTKSCVSQCQLGYYGLNTSIGVGVCSQRCPIPQWADNLTVQCTKRCSNNTYGVNYTDLISSDRYGICKNQCPINEFARDTDNLCVLNCQSGLWGNSEIRKCVTTPFDCQDGYYADSNLNLCVLPIDCAQVGGVQFVADNLTRKCLIQCPDHTTIINWADMDQHLCVKQCPHDYFGYNNTKKCQLQCRANPSDSFATGILSEFADPQLRICVKICSAYPIPTFGETDTYTCVQARYCPGQTWAEIQVNIRRCVAYCPNPNVAGSTNPQKYADNITKTCVQTCPTYFYGDLQRGWGMCVNVCPSTTSTNKLQFADNYTKKCVTLCPLSQNTWGDVLSLKCVNVCPKGYFAQRLPDRYCVDVCANDTWGEKVLRTCVQLPSDCPTINGTKLYADNSTHLCEQTCSQTQNTWGDNVTRACQLQCNSGFRYNATRVCIDICPPSLDGDGSFSDSGTCYYVCISGGYYRDPQNQRSCQSQCSFSPIKYYADSTKMKCVINCPVYPKYYYAYDPDKVCREDCPSSTMRDPITRKCVDTCPNNTFYDLNSDSCVANCPTDFSTGIYYFGDQALSLPSCVAAVNCSANSFADHKVGLCVTNCSDNKWKYQHQCIEHCPDGYYGNLDTGFCVTPANCSTDNYADNQTKTCVAQCNGTFADLSARICKFACPDGYFADPYTRLCSTNCTQNSQVNLIKNQDNKKCVSECSQYLFLDRNNSCEASCPDPLFADRSTQICVDVCPSSPPYFGDQHSNQCVEQCDDQLLEYKHIPTRKCVASCPTGFRDNFTRFCVDQCVNVTYADDNLGYCVYNCSPRYSLDDPNVCVTDCPQPYYRDPTTFKCVLQCPHYPTTYFKVITASDRRCDVDCPGGQYRDYLSRSCVTLCPPSPATYADNSSKNCLAVCPGSTYANQESRKCVSKCPSGMFITETTKKCVSYCINGTDTYADNFILIPACVSLCSPGSFADPYNLRCVKACGLSPKTYAFENTSVRLCMQSCPYPYVADNSTHKCKLQCNSVQFPYLDKASKSCVQSCSQLIYKWSFMPTGQTVNGTCVKYCPPGRFALLTNYSCVPKCPDGLYGDIENNTCYNNCSLANDKFADSTNNMCVDVCAYNTSYDSYGDLFTRTCVTTCPEDKGTVADKHTRLCEPSCTNNTQYINPQTMKCVDICPDNPLMFADPLSRLCVEICSNYSLRFGYIVNRTCVQKCPNNLYANTQTRLCVSADQCAAGTYALDPQRICVEVCPMDRDYYADPNNTNKCVVALDCPNNTFADPNTRLCVPVCPTVPSLYGLLSSRKCVTKCPNDLFGDNYTRRCVSNCSTGDSIIRYADNSTNLCVEECPTEPNFFASSLTYECVYNCPSSPSRYADYSIRKCVKSCPVGNITTFADDSSRQCVQTCLNNTFMQNSTSKCVINCTQGFADPISRYCIAFCPKNYYAHLPSRVCLTACPEQTPQLYAEDNTSLCQSSCLQQHGTFADDSTNRCVPICPLIPDLYAQPINRVCIDKCLQSPYQLADFSTRSCVPQCPKAPSLFGINSTRICVTKCPNNTWADERTRTCVSLCPNNPQTFGDNSTWTCVSVCPTKPMTYGNNYTRICVIACESFPDFYADNLTRKCVYNCPQGTFADNTTRKCVQTCPDGYYGRNKTFRCVKQCSSDQFADHLLRLCVSKCSVDPIYYGNPDTHVCVEQCPPQIYFGNLLTQECVKYNNNVSGCPDYYYSDNSTRLCVPICPLKQDTYGDNSTWKCVAKCPGGNINTFSDNSTMMCVSQCPQYPEYYAENYTRRCVVLCLQANLTYSGSFADNSTRLCVQKCPQKPDYYSDNSTRRCVFNCPQNPVTFADYSTRRCVAKCPQKPDIFGDFSTLRCVLQCPEIQATYADPISRTCVKVCPTSPPLYGQNSTNRCVKVCSNGSYADNVSRLCVARCPEYPDTYADNYTNRCVTKCPGAFTSQPDYYANTLNQTCVLRCPPSYYAQNDTRRCLPTCPMDKVNYADNLTNRCVSKCPQSQGTYGDNSTRKCVGRCPAVPFTYADNITRMCLTICNNITEGGWGQNQTRVCVKKCPNSSYGNNFTRRCTRYCPDGFFGYPVDNVCVQQCPQPYFADNTTQLCVLVCPVSQLLFGEHINRTCTARCPQGTYADLYSQQCVEKCPGQLYDTYAYELDNTCVQQCPIPLYAYPVTYVCIDICLNPYYQNITDHRCYRCPLQCSQCNYPQLCITCIQDHYLYSGSCLESCPTFPVITYANPNGYCGTAFQCTDGYFALNTTKSCVTQCPSGYYKNTTLQSCDNCIRGCSYCRNSSACITCNQTLALWDDYKCYLYCSLSRHYYTDIGCVSSCPQGTYLQLTSCLACSSICKRCSVQPQNCITCANGYYLSNNLCVQQCPQNTKAVLQNSSLYCKSCSLTDCTVVPLTYQVAQYEQNFEYSFRIKFSQPVSITEDISKVIQIKQKATTRRVLQTIYHTVDYTIYDYGNGQYVFILNNFDTRDNQNMQFEISIVNPQAITSQSGQFPKNTRNVVILLSSNYYSINDYNKHISNYCLIVVCLGVVLLVLTFWNNQSIWIPVIDYFQLLFALLFINVTIPPNPTFALSNFKLATFGFIPNMFSSAFKASPPYDKSISGTMYSFFRDMTFLRVMGYLFTILLILVILMVIMVLIWKKMEKYKSVKKFCRDFVKQRFWKKHLHGLIYLLFLPTMVIGLMKMRNYSTAKNNALEGFSIFCSYIFMLGMLIGIAYSTYKLFRLFRDNPSTCLMLKKGYDYISSQQVIFEACTQYYFVIQGTGDSKNQVDLKNISQPRINQKLILPYPIQTKFSALQVGLPIIQYLYKLLIAFLLVVSFSNAAAQLILILAITLANLIYFYIMKPYIHQHFRCYNNYLVYHNLIAYMLITIVMSILVIQQNQFTYNVRVLLGDIICGLIIISITVNIMYFLFRTILWYKQNVWRRFIASEMFKQNYTVSYWDYKKQYETLDAERKKKSGKRSQFLQAIRLPINKDGLENMVIRDPNQMEGKAGDKKQKNQSLLKLRPSRHQELNRNIKQMFQNFQQEKQKSHRSLKSSERLSKAERMKVQKQIFADNNLDKKEQQNDYTAMKIEEKSNQDNSQNQQENITQYEYEYIEEQYPEGTDINEIIKECKKGEFIMP